MDTFSELAFFKLLNKTNVYWNGFLKRSYFNPYIEVIYTVEDSGCKDIGVGVLEFDPFLLCEFCIS